MKYKIIACVFVILISISSILHIDFPYRNPILVVSIIAFVTMEGYRYFKKRDKGN